jgi:hypothetical protein
MPSDHDDAERWRERAAEARAAAGRMSDPLVRRMMLFIAAAYERLAKHADTRSDQKKEGCPHN